MGGKAPRAVVVVEGALTVQQEGSSKCLNTALSKGKHQSRREVWSRPALPGFLQINLCLETPEGGREPLAASVLL